MAWQLSDFGRLIRDRSGAVAVEAAIVMPALFAMSFTVIEAGRAMWMQNSLQDAVDAAARCGVVSASCATDAQIKSYAAGQVRGFSVASSNFTVSNPTCGLYVSASLPFRSEVLGLGSMSMTLRADSCRPKPV